MSILPATSLSRRTYRRSARRRLSDKVRDECDHDEGDERQPDVVQNTIGRTRIRGVVRGRTAIDHRFVPSWLVEMGSASADSALESSGYPPADGSYQRCGAIDDDRHHDGEGNDGPQLGSVGGGTAPERAPEGSPTVWVKIMSRPSSPSGGWAGPVVVESRSRPPCRVATVRCAQLDDFAGRGPRPVGAPRASTPAASCGPSLRQLPGCRLPPAPVTRHVLSRQPAPAARRGPTTRST